MESFVLGSECDLIFPICFVSQTIQNIFEILIFKKKYVFKILKKITKTVHYLGLTYGKFHSGIWMLKIWFTWHGLNPYSVWAVRYFHRMWIFGKFDCRIVDIIDLSPLQIPRFAWWVIVYCTNSNSFKNCFVVSRDKLIKSGSWNQTVTWSR
jgi:hypothetical protein